MLRTSSGFDWSLAAGEGVNRGDQDKRCAVKFDQLSAFSSWFGRAKRASACAAHGRKADVFCSK